MENYTASYVKKRTVFMLDIFLHFLMFTKF